jgi:hypothetical protein
MKLIKNIAKFSSIVLILSFLPFNMAAQKSFEDLEKLESKREGYYVDIYKITQKYPDFSYELIRNDNGAVTDVKVNGVQDAQDRKRLEVYIHDLQKSKRMLENVPTRTGIYYSAEQSAEPEIGYNTFYEKLYDNISYPDEAENKGVEGTIFVKFVVDEKGNIAFAKADEDIETPYVSAVEMMKKEALRAVQATSEKWKPAMVDDEPVAEFVILPVVFNFEANPAFRGLIQ